MTQSRIKPYPDDIRNGVQKTNKSFSAMNDYTVRFYLSNNDDDYVEQTISAPNRFICQWIADDYCRAMNFRHLKIM